MTIPVLFLLITLAVTSHAACPTNPIRLLTDEQPSPYHEDCITDPIHLLRPKSGSAGAKIPQLNCLSWRLAVETNNLRNWKVVPQLCKDYVGNYMQGQQYRSDCELVALEAIEYAESLTLARDGKEIWVFDIAETALSNLPYYSRPDVQFGALPYNSTKFHEWVDEADAPALPAVLRLYRILLTLGIRPVFLSGTRTPHTEAISTNLGKVGYDSWERLILREPYDNRTVVEFKSGKRTELVREGYVIVGNIGDQWTDLLGANPGEKTFKVPNPMYYIG